MKTKIGPPGALLALLLLLLPLAACNKEAAPATPAPDQGAEGEVIRPADRKPPREVPEEMEHAPPTDDRAGQGGSGKPSGR